MAQSSQSNSTSINPFASTKLSLTEHETIQDKQKSEIVPSTMKAVVVHEYGGPNALVYHSNFPTPVLKEKHVIVRNNYAGLNFIDTYHRKGLYPRKLPFVAGQEAGGIIADVLPSDASSGFQIGDRVVYTSLETYSEYSLVPISKLIKIPDDIPLDVATASAVQGLTAHYLVSSAHANLIKPEEWMLIYNVGSGTCQWAAQMAKLKGYRVIGTTSKGKVEIASKAHCDDLIVLDEVDGKSYADYGSVDITKRVMEMTNNEGVKCIIDGVGKSTCEISLNCLAHRGIFISFGNASGVVEFPILKLSSKSAYVTRPKLLDYIKSKEELQERSSQIFQWIREGKLVMSIEKEFGLEDAVNAHEYIEAGCTKGKILLKMGSESGVEKKED
jgi:NADPH2:quinone reductase